MTRLAQKTPSGGIQAVAKIRFRVIDDSDTYSIQALQKRVRKKLKRGATPNPNRPKRK
jgi:hypothetical protein